MERQSPVENQLQEYLTSKISDHQISMSHDDVASLVVKYTPEQINTAIHKLIDENLLTFPYKKYFSTGKYFIKNPREMFDRLTNYKPTIDHGPIGRVNVRINVRKYPLTFRGKPTTVVSRPEDYAEIDVIADLFTEPQRMVAKRVDEQMSPMDFYSQNAAAVFMKLYNQHQHVTTENLREAIYEMVRECTQFKPTLAFTVYKMLGAKRILDISAGWGDRLVGAMASGASRYLGFDPNTTLRDGHLQLANLTSDRSAGNNLKFPPNYEIRYEPFETAVIGENFDVCFSSPPFFEFETYVPETGPVENQSIVKHKGFKSWLNDFLFASLRNAWSALSPNGFLAIHIVDAGRNPIVMPMNDFIGGLPGAEYQGMIGARGGSKKIVPIWVWQKN